MAEIGLHQWRDELIGGEIRYKIYRKEDGTDSMEPDVYIEIDMGDTYKTIEFDRDSASRVVESLVRAFRLTESEKDADSTNCATAWRNEMAERKIIQITACGHENTPYTQQSLALYALCDDGTVWALVRSGEWYWELQPDIPQPNSSPPCGYPMRPGAED